jgi:adenylate cyclase
VQERFEPPAPPRPAPARATLGGTFLGLTALTFAVVGVLLYASLRASEGAVLETATGLRRAAAQRVATAVTANLEVARREVRSFEEEVESDLVDPTDPRAVERALFAALLREPTVADATFTRASLTGYDAGGEARFDRDPRWEVAVYRQGASIATQRIEAAGGGWRGVVTDRLPGEGVASGRRRETAADDPTRPLTFTEAARRGEAAPPLWSDLHWSELDPPGARRTVVMSVQKGVYDAHARFIGVVRVSLHAEQIDAATHVRASEGDSDAADPYRIFLCDAQGRLLTRTSPDDRLDLSGDDLRVVPARRQPALEAALRLPALARAEPGQAVADALEVRGRRYLATFEPLPDTQDWIVGVVVPEDVYTGRLLAMRGRLVLLYMTVGILALGAGAAATRSVRQGMRRVDRATAGIQRFDFGPRPVSAPFRDIERVLESLERAKTALRALGKYAPLDLVKELVRQNAEPCLGGQLLDVTVMFTDIEGFTSLAEHLTPNELADLLGAYLEAMTAAIRSTGGTIDKFIGDSVMALWNAPTSVDDHPRCACRAVLACLEATRHLYASPQWRGLAPLVTRFGVHTDRVMVGHFGAPERMSYTALGDGVNLASRLEALGKQYGVAVLVSDAVVRQVGDAFVFRRVDKVAVKGKSVPVLVHELLGPAGTAAGPAALAYERALDDYFARRFDAAIAGLEPHAAADGPSRTLLARSRKLREAPPPPEWDGAYVATSK